MELVQEIHHLLMDREDTCHRTCFSLQLNNMTLDNFSELKTIEGLKDGSIIRVVEEPYTVREARIHVRHVRDLLKSLDPIDAYNGVDCNSLSFLSTIAQGDILSGMSVGSVVFFIQFPCGIIWLFYFYPLYVPPSNGKGKHVLFFLPSHRSIILYKRD